MKIYNVYHEYDVDGGFGDAIPRSDLVATFVSENDAKAFVEKYSKPIVYDRPYNELWCNSLVISETEIITSAEFDINKRPEEYGTTWWGNEYFEEEYYSDTEE